MASNLYDTLGLSRHATQEEIRKAYRRRALETHPDRLPQNASAAQKATSEEMFRKVNNAYEVLNDPSNRKLYDEHGVWPPPGPQNNGRHGSRDHFGDPFSQDPFFSNSFFSHSRADPFSNFPFQGGHSPLRGFTDPFVLFNSIFGDLHGAFSRDPFFNDPFDHSFSGRGVSPFNGGFTSPLSQFFGSSPFDGPRGNTQSFVGSSRGLMSGGNGRWTSETWTTQTINGVTQTKCIRKDSEGNESVIYKLPDGTVRRTLNGIEQTAGSEPRAIEHVPRDHGYSAPQGPPPPYEGTVYPPPGQPHSSQPYRDPHSSGHHGRHDTAHGSQYAHSDQHGVRSSHSDRYNHGDRHGHGEKYGHSGHYTHDDKYKHKEDSPRYDGHSRHGSRGSHHSHNGSLGR
ncbi:hypothetical protein SCLCIDRAFT_1209521 [Scleroderma citrinum Foug A]|uniref:J domain-containing protein n=1 Tax=Scleroderma citrinum Foug A TaxID=1036808 RepID=A0A0C3A3B7_9AGAM|nr:hypothetical protein SCLCIDRAFT_1209521 [Scleroderma citrinum Foug A]